MFFYSITCTRSLCNATGETASDNVSYFSQLQSFTHNEMVLNLSTNSKNMVLTLPMKSKICLKLTQKVAHEKVVSLTQNKGGWSSMEPMPKFSVTIPYSQYSQ